ncbi:hypothetical protein OIU84_016141 [Salix udensis]|uniref:Uncharacterized protein n=1 Tax=Salix udensis TaxID=889485 RepID=A0AAD6NQ20_9ROSI|nr:hypothetical protein OIU84_016141 [Salix udensis]
MALECKTPTGPEHKIPETAWDCKTPTGEEHKIPILNTCPPAPGPRWLLDSLSEKKKASKMNSMAEPKCPVRDTGILQHSFQRDRYRARFLPGCLEMVSKLVLIKRTRLMGFGISQPGSNYASRHSQQGY